MVDSQTAVIFDLDDTLYKERQFQVSGFRAVLAKVGIPEEESLIQQMLEWSDAGQYPLGQVSRLAGVSQSESTLLEVYRSHSPTISLAPGALDLLTKISALGGRLGLLTDGRSQMQRNKIQALGIDSMFQAVAISEELGSTKPAPRNYRIMSERLSFPSHAVVIADNPSKDFVTPNRLGWTTVQVVDDGSNIHPQVGDWPESYSAQYWVPSLSHLLPVSRI